MQKRQTNHSWPSLETADLLRFLQELQFQATANDFKEPVPEIIRNIYEQFAELLLGVAKEDLSQLPFEQLQMLKYDSVYYHYLLL